MFVQKYSFITRVTIGMYVIELNPMLFVKDHVAQMWQNLFWERVLNL